MDVTWWLVLGLVGVLAYLWGSVSPAALVARAHGVDILKVGSGKPGATNVKRVVGRKAGNLVFGLDFAKGLLGAGLPYWVGLLCGFEEAAWLGVVGLVATVVGHCCSVFLGFKGGKGVASTVGGLAGLMPVILLLAVPFWLITFYLSRMVSLASIVMVVVLPPLVWLVDRQTPFLILSLVLVVLIVVRHRSNLARILRGEENRFDKRS